MYSVTCVEELCDSIRDKICGLSQEDAEACVLRENAKVTSKNWTFVLKPCVRLVFNTRDGVDERVALDAREYLRDHWVFSDASCRSFGDLERRILDLEIPQVPYKMEFEWRVSAIYDKPDLEIIVKSPFVRPPREDLKVVIPLYTTMGEIVHGVSNSAWKRYTLRARFDSAHARGFVLRGVAVYHNCTVVDKIQDNAVIGVVVSDYDKVVVTKISGLGFHQFPTESCVYALRDAIVVKACGVLGMDRVRVVGGVEVKPVKGISESLLEAGVHPNDWDMALPVVDGVYIRERENVQVQMFSAPARVNEAASSVIDFMGDRGPLSNCVQSVAGAASSVEHFLRDEGEVLSFIRGCGPALEDFRRVSDAAVNAATSVERMSGTVTAIGDGLQAKIAAITDVIGGGCGLDFAQKVASALVLLLDVVDTYDFKLHRVTYLLRTFVRILDLFDLSRLVSAFAAFIGPHLATLEEEGANHVRVAPSSEEVQVQSGEQSVIPLVIALVGTLVLGAIPSASSYKGVMTKLRDVLAVSSFIRAANPIGELLNVLIPDFIRVWIRELCPSEDWYYSLMSGGKFRSWFEAATQVCDSTNKELILYDIVLQDQILNVHAEGCQIVSDSCLHLDHGKGSVMVGTLRSLMTRLDAIVDTIRAARSGLAARRTPFCVALSGLPGIGKSAITPLIARVLAPDGLAENNLIYSRNSSSDHWDGYHGQFCTIMDDFYQMPESHDIEELFQMITTSKYALRMASLDNPIIGRKGTLFSSSLVVLNTNSAYPDARVNNVRALWRRRHLLAIVEVNELGMTNGCVDQSKFKKDFSHLDFMVCDPVNQQAERQRYGLKQFLTLCVSSFDAHNQRERAIDASKDILASMVTNVRIREPVMAQARCAECAALGPTQLCGICVGQRKGFIDVDSTMCDGCGKVCNLIHKGLKVCVDCVSRPFDDDTTVFVDGCRVKTNMYLDQSLSSVFEKARREIELKGLKPEVENVFAREIARVSNATRLWLDNHPRVAFLSKVVVMVGGLYASIKIGASVMDFLNPRKERESVRRESPNDNELQRRRTNAQRRGKWNAQGFSDVEPLVEHARELVSVKGSTDPSATILIHEHFMPAMVNVVTNYVNSDGINIAGGTHGFMVCGTIMLAPYHLFVTQEGDLMPINARFTFYAVNEVICTTSFDPRNLIKLVSKDGHEKDMAVYRVGPIMRSFKNQLKHLMSESDLAYHEKFVAELITITKGTPMTQLVNASAISSEKFYQLAAKDHREQILVHGWEYRAVTPRGSCGGLLVAHNTRMIRKIVGMHVAGAWNEDRGQSELISCEQITDAIKRLPGALVEARGLPPTAGLLDFDRPCVIPNGNLTYLGVLAPRDTPRYIDETDLIPSPLFDVVFPHVSEPAVLSPRDTRPTERAAPLRSIAERFGSSCVGLKVDDLESAADHVSNIILGLPHYGGTKRILTEHECINGVPEYEYFDSINMDTSPGYPYVKHRPVGSKGKFFLFKGEPGDYVIDDLELRLRLDVRESAAKVGNRVPSLWTIMCKDEKRPLEKILSAKTRGIIGPPLDLTLLFRKYCLGFNAFFYSNRLEFFSAIGINPESDEWDKMTKKLLGVSSIGFAGDFGNYDGTLMPDVMDACFQIVNKWYDDEHTLVRNVIFNEFIHTMMICVNTVVVKHVGNPSGCPMTATLNSIVNNIYMAYLWLQLAPKHLRDLRYFHNGVCSFVYGDDNINAVLPQYIDFFNMETVANEFAKLGLTYTSPNKVDQIVKYQNITDWTFLKRGFRLVHGMWLPTLNLDTIHEMVNWIHKCDDHWFACEENCNMALRYVFFHGKGVFEHMRNSLLEAARKLERPLNLIGYAYLNAYYGSERCMPVLEYSVRGSETVRELVEVQGGDEPEEKRGNPVEEIGSESKFGVVVTRQIEIEHGGVPGGISSSIFAAKHLAETPWDLNAMVAKPAFVTSFQWPTSVARGSALYSADLPHQLIFNTINHMPFQMFCYWRGRMVIDVQINGTKFHTGRLMMFHMPGVSRDSAKLRTYNTVGGIVNATSLNHILLDPSESSIGSFTIPFQCPYGYININSPRAFFDYLGSIHIIVLNILQVGAGGSLSLNVSVTVRFEDNEFKVPVPTGLVRAVDDFWTRERVYPQGNTTSINYNMSKVHKAIVGGSSSTSENFRELGAGSTNKVSGLDKPNYGMEPPQFLMAPFAPMSNATNITHMERISLDPSIITLPKPEDFGTTVDEMDYKWLTSKWGLIKMFPWATTGSGYASGDILYSQNLCPLPNLLNNTWRLNSTLNLTPIEFLTMKHTYWHGALKFRVQVIASAYHTGKLFVGIHYGTINVPTTIADVTSQYGVYIDLGDGKHDYEIIVPYETKTRWLKVPTAPQSSTYVRDYSMGMMGIHIINPLVAPTGVSLSVDINVWFAGGEDYQVATPGLGLASVIPLNVLDIPEREKVCVQSVAAPSPSNVIQNMDGDVTKSVGDLIKRFYRFNSSASGNILTPPVANVLGLHYDITRTLFSTDNTYTTPDLDTSWDRSSGLFSFYASMYRGYRGSFRFRVQHFAGDPSATAAAPTMPQSPKGASGISMIYTPHAGSGAHPMTGAEGLAVAFVMPSGPECSRVGGGSSGTIVQSQRSLTGAPITTSSPNMDYLNFEIPYHSIYNYISIPVDVGVEANLQGYDESSAGSIMVTDKYFTGNDAVDVYVAAGDEGRFGMFIGIPICRTGNQNAYPDGLLVP